MWLYFGLSTGFVYEGFFFWRISIREITSWLQVINCGCRMAFFVGYQLGGWFFKSPKFRRFSIKSGSMKTEQFNRPVLHKRYFCNSQPGHNEDGVAEMPMVRCKPAAGWFPTPRVPRANMGDPYHIGADGIVTLSAMRELELLPVLFTLPPIRRWHTFWRYEGFFWLVSIWTITSWLQIVSGGCRIALFVGSYIEGYFFGVSSFTKVCLYSYDYYDNSI